MVEIKRYLIKYALFSSKLVNNFRASRTFCNSEFRSADVLQKEPELPKDFRWRVLFFGTDEFALESLKRLHREYRSQRLLDRLEAVTAYEGAENAVIKYAKDHGIKVHNWPLPNSPSNFDIGLVVSFGHLLPTSIIESFPLGMINVHASLLPRWRGAAPIIYALMNGDKVTGVSIMKIAPKRFDIGEILDQRQVEIDDHETQPELHKRLADTGGDLLVETLSKLPGIIESGRPQSQENVSYASKVHKNMAIVKWDEMTAQDVYNLQRALTGLFSLKTTFRMRSLKMFGVKLPGELPRDVYLLKSIPGLIFYDEEKKLLMVQCKNDSWITVETISMPGKRKMSATDFSNGFIKNRSDKVIVFGGDEELEGSKVISKRL